jgi:hypothetical protein
MAPPTPAKLVAAVVAVADDHFYSSVLWNIALDAGEQSGRRQAAIQEEAPSDNGRRSCLQRLAQVSDGRSRTGSAIKLWIQYLRGRCSTCGSMARTTAMALGGRRFCEGLLRCRSEIAEWAKAALLAGLPQARLPTIRPPLCARSRAPAAPHLATRHDTPDTGSAVHTAIHEMLRLRLRSGVMAVAAGP